jgi:hypothetical protein
MKYSTAVLLLLELKDPDGQTAWEQEDVMIRLGIASYPKKGMPSKDMPDGFTTSRCDALSRFLHSVRNQPSARRQGFIEEHGDCSAGREAWTEWFGSRITKRLNHLVEIKLTELGHHPTAILSEGSSSTWPDNKVHTQPCIQPIGFDIFGPTLENEDGYMRTEAHSYMSSVLILNFVRMKKAWNRARNKLDSAREKAQQEMKSMFIHFRMFWCRNSHVF